MLPDHDGVLRKWWERDDAKQVPYQILLPQRLREGGIRGAHHDLITASHRGVSKTTNALRYRYYWPGLTKQMYRYVSHCHECGSKKNYGKKRRASLNQYIVGALMEWIALDILASLPVTLQESEYILVISDYFTKWAKCYVISNQEATTGADKLVNEFISRFGVPRQLHSDQGTDFKSNVMAEIFSSTSRRPERRCFTHNRMARWNGSIECLWKC